MNLLTFFALYFGLGVLFVLLIDLLNEFYIPPQDRVQFTAAERTFNSILWPIVLYIFLNTVLHANSSTKEECETDDDS